MCKLVLKSSSNDTVKGFDGVHLLPTKTGFELWLGESKFYADAQEAIREAVKSVEDHMRMKQLNALMLSARLSAMACGADLVAVGEQL
jgi:hypothetical protein